jgi:hypothetical protein
MANNLIIDLFDVVAQVSGKVVPEGAHGVLGASHSHGENGGRGEAQRESSVRAVSRTRELVWAGSEGSCLEDVAPQRMSPGDSR